MEARLTVGGGGTSCCVVLSGPSAGGPHSVHLSCPHQPQQQQVSRRDVASQTSATNLAPPPPPQRPDKRSPRTVHIDVYCTASDSSSSPETQCNTVFETPQTRVVHTRQEGDAGLPHALQRQKRRVLSGGCHSESSAYPPSPPASPSPSSSLPSSWGPLSPASSVTSAKDSSLDTFDYDNSVDRLRIEDKEKAWRKTWRSPELERRLLKKRTTPLEPQQDSSSSENEEDSECLSWSFPPPAPPPPLPPPTLRLAAQRFGPLVPSPRKPGHHVGPSKNPDCSCHTCRYHFDHAPRQRSNSDS